jgi:predicted RNase H-like HicB family nuclease
MEHYSMVIVWSDEDQAYVVSLPEWEEAGHTAHTHGQTYEEAVTKGHDLLAFLVESAREDGETLPQPRRYASA